MIRMFSSSISIVFFSSSIDEKGCYLTFSYYFLQLCRVKFEFIACYVFILFVMYISLLSMYAAAEGRELVQILLAAGADPTAQDTQHGRTALHTAAMANNVELVRVRCFPTETC